jgi:hypothetical protein
MKHPAARSKEPLATVFGNFRAEVIAGLYVAALHFVQVDWKPRPTKLLARRAEFDLDFGRGVG